MSEIDCWVHRRNKPQIGDIVLFDCVFRNEEHDHIAIIVDVNKDFITTAEGNFNNVSAIVKRTYNNVRGYIRLDDKKTTWRRSYEN